MVKNTKEEAEYYKSKHILEDNHVNNLNDAMQERVTFATVIPKAHWERWIKEKEMKDEKA